MTRPAFLTRIAFGVAIGATVAGPACAQARTRVDTTFAFDKSGSVMLTLPAGDIRVTAWARNEVRVVGRSERSAISASFAPRRLVLEIRGRSGGGRAQYDVTVPIGVRVVAKAGAGSINVSGTRGELSVTATSATVDASETAGRTEIESATGRVRLQRITGVTSVSTLNGVIRVSEIEGDLDLSAISGTVTVDGANLANLDFKGTAADFDFAGTLAATGRHSIESNSGDVTLHFPSAFGATIELNAFSGKVSTGDFPVTVSPSNSAARNRSYERRELSVNGGGAVISIKTFSGDVFLRKIGAIPRR